MEKLMQINKARVVVDGIEVEAEGQNVSVAELVAQAIEARRTLGPGPMPAAAAGAPAAGVEASPVLRGAMVSTNTIASLANASTGSDLVMAAMAQLTLIQGKDASTRREILDEMKAARTFYKDTFSGNLSSYLDSLAKGKRLNLVAKETFALPNAERQNFERLIASAS